MNRQKFSVEVADWGTEQVDIRHLREAVFVVEQHVPLELEWDGLDPRCFHTLARDTAGQAIGTGRLCPEGHIGRMAVVKTWRGQGVGTAVLQSLLTQARIEGYTEVHLHAQTYAVGFYERAGFQSCGEVFMDAGIPHQSMQLSVTPPGDRGRQ